MITWDHNRGQTRDVIDHDYIAGLTPVVIGHSHGMDS